VATVSVGIAVPCFQADLPNLYRCLESIRKLNPPPHRVLVHYNFGLDLKTIRTELFDSLFRMGCDVVLNCDADFYLLPHILRYVRSDRVVSFNQLERRVADVPMTLAKMFWNRSWTGCYSIPRQIWFSRVREWWDGSDSSVKRLAGKYVFERRFCYYALRPWQTETTRKLLVKMSLPKRLLWSFMRLKT